MPFKVTDESGKEIEVYSAEEVAARDKEVETFKTEAEAKAKEATEARAEAEKANRVLAEKNINFKRYQDMNEEEKKALTAKDIENIQRAEAAEKKALDLEQRYDNDKKAERESLKTKAIDAYSKGDEDLKKKLTENYDLVKIDGVDQDSIQRKVELSYNMLGLGKPKINPFSQHYVGEAPNKGMEEKFADTDKGKAGLSAMGEVKFK